MPNALFAQCPARANAQEHLMLLRKAIYINNCCLSSQSIALACNIAQEALAAIHRVSRLPAVDLPIPPPELFASQEAESKILSPFRVPKHISNVRDVFL